MLRRVRADLHVHTCLSPCGDLRMSPQKIAARAGALNISMIAVCDHNSAANVPAVTRAAAARDIVVVPGMEICSSEEIHLLALFESAEGAFAMQALVYEHLAGENNPDAIGLQVIASEADEVLGFEHRLLIGAVSLPLERIVDEVHRLGGVAIASHIDRESYSVISQLGFVPDTVAFDALELSPRISTRQARERFGQPTGAPFVRNSDAHLLDDLGANTSEYLLGDRTLSEIRKAFRREDGRQICES
jgi:3',5'-nucleoside bisphosphate phosphatase